MNTEKHTHEIRIESNSVYTTVEYGDTHKEVSNLRWMPFYRGRVKRAIRKVIHRHNSGSVRAGKMATIHAKAVADALEYAETINKEA